MRMLLPATLLGLSTLATTSQAQTVGALPAVLDGTTLDINAEGRTTRVPDIATLRAGVTTQSPTAAAALADNAERMARVLAAIKRAGIAPRDVQTSSVALSPQYRYAENQPAVVTGYQASNTVNVRFRDIAKAGPILDALVREGANQIDGPTLTIDNPDAALDEARTDAVKRARARADLYARAAGLSVVRIVSIGEGGENAGGPQPPVFYARAASMQAKADTAIAAGERDVTVNLTIRFLLR